MRRGSPFFALVARIDYRPVRVRKRFIRQSCGVGITGRVVDHAFNVRGFREFGKECLLVETCSNATLHINKTALQREPQRRLFTPMRGGIDIGQTPLYGFGDFSIVQIGVR